MGPCAFCRQAAAAPRSCPRCRALYHADCWDANDRRCAIYGCEPARPAVLHVLPPAAGPRANWGWIVFGLIVATNLPRLLNVGPAGTRRSPAPLVEVERRPWDGPAEQPFPADPRQRRRRDLDAEAALLERARASVPRSRETQLQRLEIELRIAELRRMRERLGD